MENFYTATPKTYRLLKCLHESQNSKVFKVLCEDRESKLSQILALKIINSKNSFQDCVNELMSLKVVKSPYCVSVYNWEKINGQPALALEYIEGVNLKKLVESTLLDSAEINYLSEKIFLGLKALKSSGLFHGDLSLTNVIVDNEGKIKLIDYGLSNSCGKYTPNFAAPEVLSSRKYSFEADLYALGKIIKFLGGSPRVFQILLSDNPSKRVYKKTVVKKSAQKSLAQKVNQCMLGMSGQPTQFFKKNNLQLKKLRILYAFLFLFINSSSLQSMEKAPKHAFLTLRTTQWHEVRINELPIGFSPFFNKRVPSGEIILTWEGPKGSGQRALTLLPGENKVLNDIE
ncbi:MAG: protein kinase [Bdellovibrionaceae bacterium]|nr:protein kinase [Pseudobdellovibrionaceae bacterium]